MPPEGEPGWENGLFLRIRNNVNGFTDLNYMFEELDTEGEGREGSGKDWCGLVPFVVRVTILGDCKDRR